jgi:hypothetical protein
LGAGPALAIAEPASNGLPTVRGFVKDVSGLYNPTSMVQRVSR